MAEKRADGSIMYTYDEAVKVFNRLKKPDLTLDELILLLLGLIDKPINGKVVIQKEVFLLYNEIKDKLNVVDPHYIGYKYGMFSFQVATMLEILEQAGFIEITNKRSKKRTKYMLTEKGKRLANEILNRLSKILGKEEIERLRELRRGWDQLGHEGILKYVYQKFPEYVKKSEIREKYIHIDWGVTEA